MTANFVAQVVQNCFDKIDLDKINSEFKGLEKYQYGRISDKWINKRIDNKEYKRWLMACGVLNIYLKMNYGNFEQTELVYRWAKEICDLQINDKNLYRAFGNAFDKCPSFDEWLYKRSTTETFNLKTI